MARYTPTPTTATLRKLTTVLVPLCTLFVLIVSPIYPVFAAGLIPAFFTLFLNGLLVIIQRRAGPKGGLSRVAVALLDTLVGLAYLGALMPQWVGRVRVVQVIEYAYDGWRIGAETARRRSSQKVTLITYASAVFLVNMYVLFLVLLMSLRHSLDSAFVSNYRFGSHAA